MSHVAWLVHRSASVCHECGRSGRGAREVVATGGNTYVEPDILFCDAGHQPAAVPVAAVRLLVEVADTSLGYDRTVKAVIYARLGVAEYWSVDANTLATVVFTDPRPDGYGQRTEVAPTAPLTPARAPMLALAMVELGIGAR
ncbi:MAG: Uma2 family endonuclease [Hyphomicrobiaceae bacterium]|nr:Uma2 family endonuclease [Hyphomicrobiaceae bacterium]